MATATMPSVAPATERFLDLTDYRARLLEAGEGIPTICIHGVGFTSSAETWLPAIRAGLGEGLHIFALDNVGWGAGERPTFEYSISYFADFIREVQDALGYAKTNIVGHSLGGWIACTFAYESPDRVIKLVLDSMAGMNATPPANVSNFQLPTEEGIRKNLAGIFDDPQVLEDQFQYQWRNVNTPNAADAYRQITKHLNDPIMRRRYFAGRRLDKIRVPTLVDWGEIGSELFPLQTGQEVASRIPGAKLNVIPGAGHFVPQQKPNEFVTAVRGFLTAP